MNRLNNAVLKLQQLGELAGKNDKKDFITTNKDDEDFLTLLFYRLNPYYSYKIRKLPEYPMTANTLTFDKFIGMLDMLRASNINDSIREDVMKVLGTADHEIVAALEGIVTKSLSLGVDTTVNKALGYDFVPSFSCGLASPLKEGMEIPLPAIIERKEDGVRCIASITDGECTLYTRQGRVLDFPKIAAEIVKLSNGEDLTFDGELLSARRTEVSGICNRNLKSGYTTNSEDGLRYSLFDVLPTATFSSQGVSAPQHQRTLELGARFLNHTPKRLLLTPSFEVTTMAEIKKINDDYIKDGEEGVIVKSIGAPYRYKRSKDWLKLKAINSCSLKVIDVDPGKGKRKGMVGALICESSCGGIRVKVGSGLSDSDVKLFTDTPPIGKIMEVTFNVLVLGTDSVTYSLFLPRYDQMRIDLDEADTLAKVKSQHIGRIEE